MFLKRRKEGCEINILKINNVLFRKELEIAREAQKFFIAEIEKAFKWKRNIETYSTILKERSYRFFKSRNTVIASEENSLLEADITVEELLRVIREGKIDSSPGPDGLGYSFYRTLKVAEKKLLLDQMNYLLTEKSTDSVVSQHNLAFIKMIPKDKGAVGPVTEVTRIRPIALMNVDVKILQKILLKRITPSLNKVLPEGVFGIKDRPIASALFRLHAVFSLQNTKNRFTPYIIRLDMENAFTFVNLTYLQYVVYKYIGENRTTRLIMSLLKNKQIAFLNRKKYSHFDIMADGVLQGSPLSSAIYTLYLLELYHTLKRRTEGVWIMGKLMNIDIVSYIDDINVVVSNKNQVNEVYKALNHFAKVTGTKVNFTKSYVWDVKRSKTLPFREMKGKHGNILGLPFPLVNRKTLQCKILNDKLIEIEHIAKKISWTVSGWRERVRLINLLIIPKFVFYLPFVKLSKRFLKKVNSITQNCIFGRYKYLSHDKVIIPASKGGLGLLDLSVMNKVALYNFVWQQIYCETRLKKLLELEESKGEHLLVLWVKNFCEVYQLMQLNAKISYKSLASSTVFATERLQLYRNVNVNLKRILSFQVEGTLENFVIKLSLKILPVKHRLHRIGLIKTYNVSCLLGCGRDEDMDHLFWLCPVAGEWISLLIRKAWSKYGLQESGYRS